MIPDVDPDDFDAALDVDRLFAPQRYPARRIGILSGTGPHGRGLARRFSMAGHDVGIGSRDADKASAIAQKLTARVPVGEGGRLVGADNAEIAKSADVLVVACAWQACDSLLPAMATQLSGKIVVSCVNPLGFDRDGPFGVTTSAGSAAEQIAALLPTSNVVGAFHHLSAALLLDPNGGVAGEDILVCGESHDAKVVVRQLCQSLTGRLGTDAGPLRLARYIEPFTAVLISVNRRYSAQTGLLLTNLNNEPALSSKQCQP